jgi:hypothetical protein
MQDNTEENCPICLDTISTNKNIVITNCGHTFHCICLMKTNSYLCPCCRTKIIEDNERPTTNLINLDFLSNIEIMNPISIYNQERRIYNQELRRVQRAVRAESHRHIDDLRTLAYLRRIQTPNNQP